MTSKKAAPVSINIRLDPDLAAILAEIVEEERRQRPWNRASVSAVIRGIIAESAHLMLARVKGEEARRGQVASEAKRGSKK